MPSDRRLLPCARCLIANSGDAFLEQDRCKIPPISFAIYHRRLSGDDRPATDWEFAEEVRLIGMSTKKHYEREERCDHHFPGRPSFGRRRAARRFREVAREAAGHAGFLYRKAVATRWQDAPSGHDPTQYRAVRPQRSEKT
jgi:hypothetical protein